VLDSPQLMAILLIRGRDSAAFGEFAQHEGSMNTAYLTTNELAAKIKYDSRTISERLKDSVLIEGTHYVRPFGGRKILYVWKIIERDMATTSKGDLGAIPMANGGVAHG
jgi:hypothetical protein